MNWYYVEQGKQAGPVDEAQFAQLCASGQIREETLVWREGMPNWQPCRDVQPGLLPPPAPPLPPPPPLAPALAPHEAICVECGKMFPREEMIHYGDKWVCASCKPVFMQKVAEGVTHLARGQGRITEADLIARDYDVDIGGAVSKGWETFKANAGLMIAGAVVVYVIIYGVGMVFNLARLPYLNYIAGIFLTGPLTAGLWLLYIKLVRGAIAEFGDAFRGFSSRYWQLVLTTLIPMLMVIGMVAVFGIFAVALIVPGFSPARGAHTAPAISPGLFVPLGILFFIAVLGFIYITTCWRFALPLVIDKGLNFWPALQLSRRIVMKHWWGTFALLMVCALLGIAGVFACFFGVLITGPVAFAAISAHYDKVFGDLVGEPV